MPAIVTNKFRIHNAKQFVEAFDEVTFTSGAAISDSTGLLNTNMYLFIGKVTPWTGGGSDDGKLRVESLEWENVNMIWEDFTKQLIIEPQAFMVGSITNDSSMTVTRKHLGGITEAEYRL